MLGCLFTFVQAKHLCNLSKFEHRANKQFNLGKIKCA